MSRQETAERPAGAPPEPSDRRAAILETAARLICEKGYEGTSIQDIADASGLTKAGLYHHIRSKEHLLLEIQNYGMDVFEEGVLKAVMPIPDPLERLKACMAKNILHGHRGVEQRSHDHPPRARHPDRGGPRPHQRAQETLRAFPRERRLRRR